MGIPNGMRAIITMGDVKGIMEHQNTKFELGSFITLIMTMMEMITGIMIIPLNWAASCGVSTADPIAAYMDA